MNVDEWSFHLSHIYGCNNSVYITSLSEKLGLLIVSVRSLQDAIRKKRSKKKCARALAHVLAWTYALVDHFRFPSIAHYLCLKYPVAACGYCGKKPCKCLPEKRAKHTPSPIEAEQLLWNFKEWQKHLGTLYGNSNRKRGLSDSFDRLFTEIAELYHILAGSFIGRTAKDIHCEYGMEIADVIAWIIAIAVLMEIDLEKAMRSLYQMGCPSCTHNPCRCRKFVVINRQITHVPTVYAIP